LRLWNIQVNRQEGSATADVTVIRTEALQRLDHSSVFRFPGREATRHSFGSIL